MKRVLPFVTSTHVAAIVLASFSPPAPPAAAGGVGGSLVPPETLRRGNVVIQYQGIGSEYAEAIARVVNVSRELAAEQFGFDMPEIIHVTANVQAGQGARLFNDGQDRFNLTVGSKAMLRQPSQTGIFHLYGFCHEVGHLAMYRPIRDHSWLSGDAAEGWADYLGSRLVDGVFAREGKDLWPDRYDYLADGTARLKRQLAVPRRDGSPHPAGLWAELAEIVGDKGVAPIFRAWDQAAIDPADPAPALKKALLATNPDPRLAAWWAKAETPFTSKRPKSDFDASTTERGALKSKLIELAHDDGIKARQKSSAGTGHAVRFQAPGDDCYLTAVRLHGARYGSPAPPREDFHVWLCDAGFRTIADFPFPYSTFEYGVSKWVTMNVRPTKVPRQFVIVVGFNPTATKGVFVSHDAEASGNSFYGLGGRRHGFFSEGDWLIRATVQSESGACIPQLTGQPIKISHDDGLMAGRKSRANSGHTVAFRASGENNYLTSVLIHGARYGRPRAPNEDFHVWLCDADFRVIADFPFPYAMFAFGNPKWVTLTVPPTPVPQTFLISVGFNPTATKGVYMSHDAQPSGNSFYGIPGRSKSPCQDGDWLIRVTVDQSRP